jgi:glutathione peroxidase
VSVYDFTAERIDGHFQPLSEYEGKVLLIVNTASQCGFTPQYEGLQELYQKYNDLGLEILGFPCNQFGGQEPGSNADIQKFCTLNYSVSFPMYAKIDVNGSNAHPLYQYLKEEVKGAFGTEAIKWNFTKFLVNHKGNVVTRFASTTTPEKLDKAIRLALNQR